MADKYDRVVQRAMTEGVGRLNSNELHDLKKVARESSQRGRDYRAWLKGNAK